MWNSKRTLTDEYVKEHQKRKWWQRCVSVLAAVAVFCTTYALIIPAITWERTLICDIPEHQHGDACYKTVTVPAEKKLVCTEEHFHTADCYETVSEEREERVLVCGLQEHTHTSACFDAPPAENDGNYCGLSEHVHSEEQGCFFPDGTLKCTIPEHTHALACRSNPYADVESEETRKASFAGAVLSGSQAEDVLALAMTQLGYAESTRNYQVPEDGSGIKGYTRYGDWFGDAYLDWDALFCAFCLRNAGVRPDIMPTAADSAAWVGVLTEQRLYHEAGSAYAPKAGDLVFFDFDGDAAADHVGLISSLTEEGLSSVEGDLQDRVALAEHLFADGEVLGYGELRETGVSSERLGAEDRSGSTDRPSTINITAYDLTNAIPTSRLTDDDKADPIQFNYQLTEQGHGQLLKTARWLNKDHGLAEIDIHVNSSDAYGDTSALYMFTNCTRHGFSQDIACRNIKRLLDVYDRVYVICAELGVEGATITSVRRVEAIFEPGASERDINLYLDDIDWGIGRHEGFQMFYSYLKDFLSAHEPTAIYLSCDGSGGITRQLPGADLSVDRATTLKLADYQRAGRYFVVVSADGINIKAEQGFDPPYYDRCYYLMTVVNPAWAIDIDPSTFTQFNLTDPRGLYGELGGTGINGDIGAYITPKPFVDENGNPQGVGRHDVPFSQIEFATLTRKNAVVTDIVDSRLMFGEGDVDVMTPHAVLRRNTDYSLRLETVSGGTKVTVEIYNGIIGEEFTVRIYASANEFRKAEGDTFDDTNTSMATANVRVTFSDGTATEANYSVSSPKLYRLNTVVYRAIEDPRYGAPRCEMPAAQPSYIGNTVELARQPVTAWTTSDGTPSGIRGRWVFYPSRMDIAADGWNYNPNQNAEPLSGNAVTQLVMPAHNVKVFGRWVFYSSVSISLTKDEIGADHGTTAFPFSLTALDAGGNPVDLRYLELPPGSSLDTGAAGHNVILFSLRDGQRIRFSGLDGGLHIEIRELSHGGYQTAFVLNGTTTGGDVYVIPACNTSVDILINNTPETELPATGGSGLYPLCILGALLVTGSVVCGCMLRRKRERRAE